MCSDTTGFFFVYLTLQNYNKLRACPVRFATRKILPQKKLPQINKNTNICHFATFVTLKIPQIYGINTVQSNNRIMQMGRLNNIQFISQ